jgi:hypothetical protein
LADAGDATADLMAAFNSNHTGYSTGFEGSADASRIVAKMEILRVLSNEALCHVYLLERVSDDPL